MAKKAAKTRKLEETLTVQKIFSESKLKKTKASPLVRSMTPRDFKAMERAFGMPPKRVRNKKVNSLTARDLKSIDALFGDYQKQIVAGFTGVEQFQQGAMAAAGDSCCCCCTPCCSCCCAATQSGPAA